MNIARAVSEPLAKNNITILQVSTYESDYTLVGLTFCRIVSLNSVKQVPQESLKRAIDCLSSTFNVSHVEMDDHFEGSPESNSKSFRSVDTTPKLSSLPILGLGENVGDLKIIPEKSAISRQPFCTPEVEKVLVTSIKHEQVPAIFQDLLRILFYSER